MTAHRTVDKSRLASNASTAPASSGAGPSKMPDLLLVESGKPAAPARVSSAWLAAAEKLLSDVRGELGDLVGSSPTVLEPERRRARGSVGKPSAAEPINGDGDGNHLHADEQALQELVESDDEAAESDPAQDPLVGLDGEASGPARATPGNAESSLDAYLRQLRRVKAPTLEEEQELVRAAQAGYPDAMNQLVSRNLRIVPPIARTFVGRGLPLEDLIEEGNLGIYRAVPRFDLALGHRFATYARWWVKNEIRTAVLNHGRLIRLPVHVFRAMSRVRRQLESVGRSMPYVDKASDTRGALAAGGDEATRLTLVEAQALLRLTELPLSLDMPTDGGEADTPLVDTLAGEVDDSPETRIQQDQCTRLLSSAVERLSPNEREVVMRRYGFASGEPETLEEIGKSLKLTAERVRQIQKAALVAIQRDFAQRGLSLDELL